MDFSQAEHNPYQHVKENHESNLAFCIHRNKNKNVVVYAANLTDDGQLVKEEPLKVYWVMFEQEGNPTEGLNMIERNTAYGVSSQPWEGREGHYKILLTSLKDRTIDLFVEDGKVVGKGVLNGQDNCTLERVFVQSTTSWGMPKCQYIEIHGKDPEGNPVMEKKIP